ncbi:MAG TPA: AAA family ATPase [Gemmataceae bacterium]|jgi:hypothetical protein|nr:AAA family ATPase [Gemmataceae bacterium]
MNSNSPNPSSPTFEPLRFDAIRRPQSPLIWLWDGYIAGGCITLLTSMWKSGKTTLVSVLLARMATGGMFAGRTLRAGKAVIVSEESEGMWATRCQQLNLGDNLGFLCRPFRGPTTPELWEGLIDSLVARKQNVGLDLLVIDPLAAILPRSSESHSTLMLSAMAPLQRLTALGVAVLVLHHPRKAKTAEGRAARGTGALSGAVDILIEMSTLKTLESDDRRRKLRAFSRHSQTPANLVIELNAEGNDYISLGDFISNSPEVWWETVQALLEQFSEGLTRHEIIEAWPTDRPLPSEVTLWRWLDRAVATARLSRAGSGRKANPYRYWLAEDKASSA